MSRTIFLAIAITILIGTSYFTSKIYSLGFRMEVVGTRIAFFVFLIIPLLFVGSIILSWNSQMVIGPTLYREIQILAGIGFYLFIGAIILGICLLVAAITKHSLPIGVAWIVFGLSLIFAGIGFVQSRFIKTVSYTVTLHDAPASWNGKRAVLVSDTHFGLVNHASFSNKVVDAILAIHPDFVLHAGDFYDGPSISTSAITTSWKRLADTLPFFYAPGNHEEYGNYAGFLDSIRHANITILDDKKTLFDGVMIAGITYRNGKNPIEATRAIESLNLDEKTPTILINHPPTSLIAGEAHGVDLQVSGHTHKGQFWPMNYLVHYIYGPQYYGHAQFKTMQTITTGGVGTFGPPFRLFNQSELVLITFRTGK